MEGLTKRMWALGLGVIALGAVTTFMPPPARAAVSENWMEEKAPLSVGKYEMQRSESDPGQSYEMGKVTYETLDPDGIVARIYTDGDKTYDVVLIASDSSKSFHDPRVCFTASGWQIVSQREALIKTKTRGDLPMTLVTMRGSGGTSERSAIYGFKGPSGFISEARKMRWDMFVTQLKRVQNEDGVFYRFIPMSDDTSDEDLLQFAADYLDEAKRVSSGFF